MLNAAHLNAINDIYDASLNIKQWNEALDSVTHVADARAIALMVRSKDPDQKNIRLLSSVYAKFSKTPSGFYYGMFPGKLQKNDWKYLSGRPPLVPTADTEMGYQPIQLDERADYSFLKKKTGVRRRLGIRLNPDKIWFDAMSIGFDKEYDRVPANAGQMIQPLLPHIAKSVQIARTFNELQMRYRAVLAALDRVEIGLFLALPTGEIVVKNEEANSILSQEDGLKLDATGMMKCHDADQTSELAKYITQVANTLTGESKEAEHLVRVHRPSSANPYLVDVSPLRDGQGQLGDVLEGALITVIDPERVPTMKLPRFTMYYGMTPTEAEICPLIIEGMSIEQIAETRNTKPNTAKNQVAAILQKAGVNSRLELIRLLMRVMPPVN